MLGVRVTAQLGVGCIYRARVTREFNLGHHLNVTLCCICHNLAALLLCVEVRAIRLTAVETAVYTVSAP